MTGFSGGTSTRQRRQRPGASLVRVLAAFVAVLLIAPTAASAGTFGPWQTAVLEVGINTTAAEGCPIESPNGLELFIASTRTGAVGGPTDPNDIWSFRRASVDAPWGTAIHLPAPVNSASADFCPTPLTGKRLFFVSSRAGGCGAGDIYRTRNHSVQGWLAPTHLGCQADGGPNFAGGEFSPSIVETSAGTFLFYSSTGLDGLDQDIYVSQMRADGTFGPGSEVPGLNTASNDQMPNVSRNGREMVFVSDRPGTLGALDIYRSTRASDTGAWGAPVNLGPTVNTAAGESRPSLSGDGLRLHFGRLGDIWVSTRSR